MKWCYFQITENKVQVHVVDGNHVSMLEHTKIAMAINGELFEDGEEHEENPSKEN